MDKIIKNNEAIKVLNKKLEERKEYLVRLMDSHVGVDETLIGRVAEISEIIMMLTKTYSDER